MPIEMASAGMLVVTNTYANKTRDKLLEISSNIIAVPPTIGDIERGLREAAGGIPDYDRRVRGSRVNWSKGWDDALGGQVWSRIEQFIKQKHAEPQNA